MKKTDIIFEKFDEKNVVVIVKRELCNLFMDFGLYGFEEEMEYLDMPTKLVRFKGEMGYLFDKNISSIEIQGEIERFMLRYNI